MRWLGNTLAQRLARITAVSAMLVLLVTTALIVFVIERELQRTFEDRIEQEARIVAETLTAAVLFDDRETAEELLGALLQDPSVQRVSLLAPEGVAIASVGNRELGATLRHSYTAIASVLDGSAPIATVTITASHRRLQPALLKLVSNLSLITLTALIFGIALTHRLQQRALAPVNSLITTVRRAQVEKDYSLRAAVTNTDEVGQLASGINELLSMVELRELDLSKTVEDRTAELRARNEDLQREMEIRRFSERKLRESQLEFKRAFDSAPIGMALVDENGQFLSSNRTLIELLGLPAGIPFRLVNIVASEEQGRLRKTLHSLFHDAAANYSGRLNCITTAGQELICDISMASVPDDLGSVRYAVLQLSDVTEAARLATELDYQASHDSLTGLANRRLFNQALKEAVEGLGDGLQEVSLALLDLDQFKVVNDVCGHGAGDALLVQIARIITQTVRPDDLVVRLGGDEFAVLLYDCSLTNAENLAEKLRRSIEAHAFYWEGNTFRVGASIGLITLDTNKASVSEILQQVDAACFAAKDLGRNQVFIVNEHDTDLEEQRGQMHWVGRLNSALDEDDFVLFTQHIRPLTATSTTLNQEVLVRLRDRERNALVPPGAFLPSAERYGLSSRIDRWVVNRLLNAISENEDLMQHGQAYWINLSGSSISDSKFMLELEAKIDEAALPSGTLNFEVTETAVVQALQDAGDALRRLKAKGCRIALDDFGTGLSSFSYLKNLPVDLIKIDGVFVRNMLGDPVDRIFVKAIIEMAGALDIETVAEFVETEELRDLLMHLGASYGQGFALHKPTELLAAAGRGESIASQRS